MKVTLSRRWGPYRAGTEVDVSDTQGTWLVQHNYGEGGPVQVAAAPGAHGPDPLAGGDATRLRPQVPRSQGSSVGQVGGSPTFRAGFSGDDSANQGTVGRPVPSRASGGEGGDDVKKPRRSRSKSEG